MFNSDPRWKVNTEEKEISGKYNTKDVGKTHKELYFNSLKFCILWLDIYTYSLRIVISLGLPRSLSAMSMYSVQRWLWNGMKPEIPLPGSVLKFGLKPWDIPRSCLVSMWYQLVPYPYLETGYASPILIYSSKYLLTEKPGYRMPCNISSGI